MPTITHERARALQLAQLLDRADAYRRDPSQKPVAEAYVIAWHRCEREASEASS